MPAKKTRPTGFEQVPAMRDLLPERRISVGLWTHGTSVVVGVLAITTGLDPLARLTGMALMVAGVVLLANVVHVLRRF